MRANPKRRNRTGLSSRRRALLKSGSGATLLAVLSAAGLLQPRSALAQSQTWNKSAFETGVVSEALKAVGAAEARQSTDIAFVQTPEIAENGAVVPIGVTSNLPKTESIAILIEKNPNVLAAVFEIPVGTEPSISTRVKMAQTSNVTALVKADGRYYVASKEIKVTLGGCGG